MEDNRTINNDDTYRDTEGCGCLLSGIIVVIIFAIAAGLWLFTK